MKYSHIREGIFIDRPNRFIARVMVDGKEESVHVKNTGRCRELLREGVRVYLEKSGNPDRKTEYDLVGVQKGNRLVNIDSAAPNKAVGEWLAAGGLFPDAAYVRPETVFGSSRFDFYVETAHEKIFLEVKGVTLEEENRVSFPDAPSERAVKHVNELVEARRQGFEAYILFVVQMKGVDYFTPNTAAQPAFWEALVRAGKEGVHILAYDCEVTGDGMNIGEPVRVDLEPDNGKELLKQIPAPLLRWYDASHRILPWRENPTPYRVWISEIMLQQTRVEAVKPYFDRFMEALPDIAALARAPEEKLLKLWEGLGYYNRARNLQKAAIQIMELYGGRMPSGYARLKELPGIGSYTAGAISSIAFGEKRPAVDGNVLRVVARVRADGSDVMNARVRQRIEEELLEAMPDGRPGDFNQAMMELGATVCVPNKAPDCGKCPLNGLCRAGKDNSMLDYPVKSPKKPRIIEQKTVIIIKDENKVAIRKRPDRGLLAGMYEFPLLEGHRSADEVIEYLEGLGFRMVRIRGLGEAKHIFSHREWHMAGYEVRVDELAEKGDNGLLFIEPAETREHYPIPSAFAAYKKYLKMNSGE